MNQFRLTQLLIGLVLLTGIAAVFKIVPDASAAFAIDSKGIPIVPFYRQCDPAWAETAIGSSTICKNGSGPTTAAMLLNYYGKTYKPNDFTSGGKPDSFVGEAGLITSTNLSWENILWLLENDRPVIITVGPSIFSYNNKDHYLVLRGKTPTGTTIYLNDPSRPALTSASKTIVYSAYLSGSRYSLYARPADYDPCDWNGNDCTIVTPTPTPTGTASPTPTPVSSAKPTVSLGTASVSGGTVTVKATVSDQSGDKVKLQFRIRRNESNLDAAAKCQTVVDSFFTATNSKWSSAVASGQSVSYTFSNLEPGQYAWSARAVEDSADANLSDGLKFCYENGLGSAEAYGWASAKEITITASPTPTPATPTPTPKPNSNNPVIYLDSSSKNGSSITLKAKATDIDGDKVRINFRIRRDEAGWTVSQKCSTDSVEDSNYGGSIWSGYVASGTLLSYTFNNLSPGNYLWSARAEDNGTPLLRSIGSGERFCFESGLGSSEAYGWLTAIPFTIP